MAKQTITGKAFEYALLKEFYDRLKIITKVQIIDNAPYKTAKKSFISFDEKGQASYLLTASFAVNFLLDLEPCLSNGIDDRDILQLEIVSDKQGQEGDVRDVLAIRAIQKWEIGISAKNNHRAVKHSRLSTNIDFGKKWLDVPCSNSYFDKIIPIFESLATMRKESNAKKLWSSLGDYHTTIYEPILEAFKSELIQLDNNNPGIVAQRLIEYLIGNNDFYKVIKTKKGVEIQAYNLHSSLNQQFMDVKPKHKIGKLKFPNRIIEIAYKSEGDSQSKTTLIVTMDEGWQISFRIHNASSRIEPSLKFDINLESSPKSLFTNHLFI